MSCPSPSTWRERLALLAVSVGLLIVGSVALPFLTGPIAQVEASLGRAIGAWLRLAWGGAVSALALLALRRA